MPMTVGSDWYASARAHLAAPVGRIRDRRSTVRVPIAGCFRHNVTDFSDGHEMRKGALGNRGERCPFGRRCPARSSTCGRQPPARSSAGVCAPHMPTGQRAQGAASLPGTRRFAQMASLERPRARSRNRPIGSGCSCLSFRVNPLHTNASTRRAMYACERGRLLCRRSLLAMVIAVPRRSGARYPISASQSAIDAALQQHVSTLPRPRR
jgi:hypothetical protein